MILSGSHHASGSYPGGLLRVVLWAAHELSPRFAASRVIHIKDLDERLETENRAVMAIARKRQLVS